MSMHGHYIQKELCLRFPLQVITYLNKRKTGKDTVRPFPSEKKLPANMRKAMIFMVLTVLVATIS